MISIVIPTFQEEKTIEKTLRDILALSTTVPFEIIVSDGGSTDRTAEIAARYCTTIQAAKGKARQLNQAVSRTRGDILFFVHADMTLPPGALEAIRDKIEVENYDGGGFSNIFSTHNRKIKRLGRIMNLRLRGNDHARNLLFYGDNGIFCRRRVFDLLAGFREIPIMEDYDFSRRMAGQFRVARVLEPRLVVSARRHVEAGFLRTRWRWIVIKRLYQLGVSPEKLARLYTDVR